MRKILSLTTLAFLSTGGVALANPRGAIRDHRSAGFNSHGGAQVRSNGHGISSYGQGFVSPHRNAPVGGHAPAYPTYGNTHQIAPVHGNNHAQPVYAHDGRFHFSGGVTYVAPRPQSSYYYNDYNVQPAPYVEDVHDVAGYTWVPGNWQWSGYEWTWVSGYYQPIANYGASISIGAGYGY